MTRTAEPGRNGVSIEDFIHIQVVSVKGKRVRFAIRVDQNVEVVRDEVICPILKEKKE